VLVNEPLRKAEYNFDAMRADVYVRSGYYWATDTHSDWIGQYERMTQLAKEVVAALATELAER